MISHNIANMNTTGYKRQRAEFQDMLYQNMERPGADLARRSGAIVPLGIQIGVGVRADAVGRVTEQGGMGQTGNGYDIAIDGRGYLQIALPSGQTGYTRAGNLAVNADGAIVTTDGYPLEPSITVPPESTAIHISRDGIVEVTLKPDKPRPRKSAKSRSPASSIRRASKLSATICFSKRQPQARPTWPFPARLGLAR